MRTKSMQAFSLILKADAEDMPEGVIGSLEAVVARLNVIDADRDMFMKGSIGSQSMLVGAWGHATATFGGRPPLGYGTVSEDTDDRIIMKSYIMDTPEGRNVYALAKRDVENGTALVEWSVTARIAKYVMAEEESGRLYTQIQESAVYEVAPVLKGVQADTRTLTTKGDSDMVAIATAAAIAAVKAVLELQEEPTTEPEPAPEETPAPDDLEERRAALEEIKRRLEGED